MNPLAIGVDLGATKIAAALVNRGGQAVATRLLASEPREGKVIERIASAVNALVEEAAGSIAGVGIGSPGFVDAATGRVWGAVNLGWEGEVNLAADVRARLTRDLPVVVENDANASALGEGYFGSAQGERDFISLCIGSGLGVGAISGGRLIVGANFIAADMGHIVLDPGGRACPCGGKGCAETVVSGPGLIATVREMLAAGRPSVLKDDPRLSTSVILAAASAGDEAASAAVEKLSNWLGQIMAMAAVVVDPGVIVIGGGLGLALYETIAPAAEREMRLRIPSLAKRKMSVRKSTLESSAVGAACLAWGAAESRQ